MSDAPFEQVLSTIVGTVVSVLSVGTEVADGSVVALIESMKMEYAIHASQSGVIAKVAVEAGQSVKVGDLLVEVRVGEIAALGGASQRGDSVARERLAELRERESLLEDRARRSAVDKRHALGLRTARENVADLVDAGSFVEYGRFAYAAQAQRREIDELIANTPGDGMVAGIGTINAGIFGADATSCAVLSYDYTVLAGTQGQRNHEKKDRLFELVERLKVPVVFFTEGGGGRPGDTDHAVVTGLNTNAFMLFARLSGLVPTIGIAAGRCFAGNAALLGCCDVVVACEGASIGMGGPAMIEGGGLGVVAPDEVGPVSMHAAVGNVDVLVADEAAAVAVAKRILGLTQGRLLGFDAPDQGALGAILPEDRRRVYDVRALLDGLCDSGSVIELRPAFARGMVTAFARIDGRAVAVLANNSVHLAGAIDADGADKAARFMQLAEAWGLPLVTLVDTPGFMVGPDAETTGLVRHVSRMFVAGAALSVPVISVITRRGYGLGAQAMCAGSFSAPLVTVAWPQGEMGGMGLEGAVRLGFRRELEAIEDLDERERVLSHMIERAYEHGRALNVAAHLEIDDVIDPATTRELISKTLRSAPVRVREVAPRRFIDTW